MNDRKELKCSDEELVLLARSAQRGAAEELMFRYKDTVRRIARKFSFSQLSESDDLVQEGMIGLYSAIGSYDASAGKSFKNFAYTCVTRRIYTYLRNAYRHEPGGERTEIDPESLAEGATPEDLLILDESEEEFRTRLRKALSSFEYRVVDLYLCGMSYAAIAEMTGRAPKSVDNALMRAKKKLQAAFA